MNVLDPGRLLSAFGVGGIFVILLLETGLLVGFLQPGGTLLLAAGVFAALRARSLSGGVWRVSAHLARTAHWLLDAEPDAEPGQLVPAPETYQSVVRGDAGLILASKPAFSIGERDTFSRIGGRWGADEPRWVDDPR